MRWEPVKLLGCQVVKFDPWDMLNFCFHVNAQKSLFIGENVNAFLTAAASAPMHLTL